MKTIDKPCMIKFAKKQSIRKVTSMAHTHSTTAQRTPT